MYVNSWFDYQPKREKTCNDLAGRKRGIKV